MPYSSSYFLCAFYFFANTYTEWTSYWKEAGKSEKHWRVCVLFV